MPTPNPLRALFNQLIATHEFRRDEWKDYVFGGARQTLQRFLDAHAARITWVPVTVIPLHGDDSAERALAIDVLHAQTRVLDFLAPPGATSAAEVVRQMMPKFVDGDRAKAAALNRRFSPYLFVKNYASKKPEYLANAIDIRDYARGVVQADFLKLVEARAENQPWSLLRAPGAAAYQFSELSIVASRHADEAGVSFSVVRAVKQGHVMLTFDGQIPSVDVPIEIFPRGTLIRHIGFTGYVYNSWKERSVQGVLDRLIPRPAFPIPGEHFDIKENKTSKKPAVGTFALLDRDCGEKPTRRQTHREEFTLPLDPTLLEGGHALGNVTVRVYTIERRPVKDKAIHGVQRDYTLPPKPVLFTAAGRTLLMRRRTFKHPLEKTHGIVVEIDCSKVLASARADLASRGGVIADAIDDYLHGLWSEAETRAVDVAQPPENQQQLTQVKRMDLPALFPQLEPKKTGFHSSVAAPVVELQGKAKKPVVESEPIDETFASSGPKPAPKSDSSAKSVTDVPAPSVKTGVGFAKNRPVYRVNVGPGESDIEGEWFSSQREAEQRREELIHTIPANAYHGSDFAIEEIVLDDTLSPRALMLAVLNRRQHFIKSRRLVMPGYTPRERKPFTWWTRR